MSKVAKISLIVVAILLILNGLLNIFDDARVYTYDIASILSGIGLLIIGWSQKQKIV